MQNPFRALVAVLAGTITPKSLTVDASGNLLVNSSGTPGYSSENFAANNAGAQVKTGAGTLRGISVNTAGTTSTITLYDGTSTSGTLLGAWSTTAQNSLQGLNLAFQTGLFAVLAGGAAANVTVSYS